MNGPGKNILLLDGASAQILPMMRSFYKLGHTISIVCPYRLCAGFFSKYVHHRLVWDHLYTDEKETLKSLINHLKDHKIDLVLGLGEKTAELLSKNKIQISKYTKVTVPDYKIFSKAINKFKTMEFCLQNGIPCPNTYDLDNLDLENIENYINFPVIIKPKKGVGSVGVFKYMNPEKLRNDINWIVNNYGSMIIQEFIPNEEQYTVETLSDNNSKVKACIIILKSRFFPLSGGTSSCNVTVENIEVERVAIDFLEKIKWVGSANLDIIFDKRNNIPKIIEINPRVGAMVKIVFEAGIDIADMQYQLAFKSQVNGLSGYTKGIVLRSIMLEIPWLLSSSIKNTFQSKPAYFSFFGKKVFYQTYSLDDPFTSLGYFLGTLIRYLNKEVFRKKFLSRGRY